MPAVGVHRFDEPMEPEVFRAHERYAVLGGPDSTDAVVLPGSRTAAISFRQQHKDQLWCARRAGGCGQRLVVKAGEINQPYLSHEKGASPGCTVASHPEAARESYQHLALQRALKEWLAVLGLSATLEHPVDGGRLDVHVVVDGDAHALEVQRSPLAPAKRHQREATYLKHVSTVSWLWDPGPVCEPNWTDQVIEADLAFLIAIDDHFTVQVGTVSRAEDRQEIRWDPLAQCRIDEQGLWTPHREWARARTRQGRQEQEARARAEREAGEARERARADAAAAGFDWPSGSPREGGARLRPSRWLERERAHQHWWADWMPAQGADWLEELPEELREAAWFHAHFVAMSHAGHAVVHLQFVDVPDPDRLVQAALVRHKFLVVDEASDRWIRLR